MQHNILARGSVINERFVIGEVLPDFTSATGATLTYSGQDRYHDSAVLIRILTRQRDMVNWEEFKARFKRDVGIMTMLNDDHVMPIFDAGVWEERPFVVLDCLPGVSLAEIQRRRMAMRITRALDLMSGCLRALGKAHAQGIVHRGINPSSFFLTHPHKQGERLRLLHFGMAYIEQSGQERLTRTNDHIGALHYLPPEYLIDGLVTPALDVYAMGLVLVELLSGQPAVSTEDHIACIKAHTRGELSIPDFLRRGPLGEVLDKALHLDPQRRFANGRDFAEALEAVRSKFEKTLDVQCGDRLKGGFRVERRIGGGGFGEVYEGQQLISPPRPVAIKFLSRRRLAQDLFEQMVKRFELEASATSKIKHPNVVKVYASGTLEDGRPFIVMELLKGRDLAEVLTNSGPIPLTRALELMLPALEGLAEAHEHQIVHKDLKPSNLFLVGEGAEASLKILDFGIARFRQEVLTRTHQIMATPSYVSPEYIQEKMAGPATDVYQMALVLVEMITGDPVVAGNEFQCYMAHARGDLNIPQWLKHSALGHILAKALALAPEDRYANADGFAQALARVDAQRVRTPTQSGQPRRTTTHHNKNVENT